MYPHRNAQGLIVQKTTLPPIRQRLRAIEEAGYNTFLLRTRISSRYSTNWWLGCRPTKALSRTVACRPRRSRPWRLACGRWSIPDIASSSADLIEYFVREMVKRGIPAHTAGGLAASGCDEIPAHPQPQYPAGAMRPLFLASGVRSMEREPSPWMPPRQRRIFDVELCAWRCRRVTV